MLCKFNKPSDQVSSFYANCKLMNVFTRTFCLISTQGGAFPRRQQTEPTAARDRDICHTANISGFLF